MQPHAPLARLVTAGLALLLGYSSSCAVAVADPVAFVVNADSNSVSVVDIDRTNTLNHVSTWDGVSPNAGRAPQDVVFDPTSGRVFVAARARLVSFDGLLPDGRGWYEVSTLWDEGSGIALDESNRRLFMSHEEQSGVADGHISEFAIDANGQATLTATHTIAGINDLRFIAYDPRNRRIYAVEDDGTVIRSGNGNTTFTRVGMSPIAPAPGGILTDPSGGVWITGRAPAKLVRVHESGATSAVNLTGNQNPRGMAFDREVPGAILIAVDSNNRVLRYNPANGSIGTAMNTDERPQDVGVTLDSKIVSANRVADHMDGTLTINGNTPSGSHTEEKSIALSIVEVPNLSADPASKAFCYNVNSLHIDRQVFEMKNTRVDRASMDLVPVRIGGRNPNNYTISGDTCSGLRLHWGNTCRFTVSFRPGGPSNQPTNPFLRLQPATYPATAEVVATNGTRVDIDLRAHQYLTQCGPKLELEIQPLRTINGF